MFMLSTILLNNNPMIKVKDKFLKLFDEINAFFPKQFNLSKEEIIHGINIIEEIREKLLYITDLYLVSFEEFPELATKFSNNCDRLRTTFDYIRKNPNTVNITSFYQYIVNYNNLITEQYLRIAVIGLYHGIVNKKLPTLSAAKAEGELLFSIVTLTDFFKNKLKNSKLLSNIVLVLENLNSHSSVELSTYFNALAKLFTSVKGIDSIDDSGAADIAETMILHLQSVSKDFIFTNESGKPASKKQKTNSPPSINHSDYTLSFEDQPRFSKLFLLYRNNQLVNASEKIKQIEDVLFKMAEIYVKAPMDFAGLAEIFLKDVNNLQSRCMKFSSQNEEHLISEEFDMYYQEMLRRHFQLRVYEFYNNIFCNLSPVKDETSNWQEAFAAIETNLVRINNMMQTTKAKTSAKNLADAFSILKELLLIGEEAVPTIKYAKLCIIALNDLFADSNKIWDLDWKIIERIIKPIEEMRSKLVAKLENDLTNSDEYFEIKRMQIMEVVKPSINLSHPTAVACENLIAYNLFTATYSTPIVSSPFNFFSERPSTLALRQVAKSKGLTCRDVAGDGNCLFTAVALLIKRLFSEYSNWPLSKLANKLREDANNYLEQNEEIYKPFVSDKDYKASEDYKAYIKRMRNPIEWAGHIHLMALCNILNIKIVVLNSDNSNPIFVTPIVEPQNSHDVICLGYEVNLHYQALLPLDNSNNLPPQIYKIIEDNSCVDNAVSSMYFNNKH